MIPLPPALEPWRHELALFPDDLALGVGAMVQRLAQALGPMRRSGASPTGELDGYSGLDRRGSYERLLTTEWLLADEHPEEFLRRAAMGEHAFFAHARRQPAGTDSCTVLFDAGPGMLGSPRIVQIALLVTFARRAEAAGVKLDWGILQEPEKPLAVEVSRESVLRLVQARTATEVTAETLAKWRERLGEPGARDDLWIVSGREAERVPDASQVSIAEVIEPGARAVEVEVRPRAGALRQARVELPKADECVRLVRDPYQVKVAEQAGRALPIDRDFAPFFAHKNRLFVRADGRYLALHVPDTKKGIPGKPLRVRHLDLARPVALGIHAGSTVALVTDGDGLTLFRGTERVERLAGKGFVGNPGALFVETFGLGEYSVFDLRGGRLTRRTTGEEPQLLSQEVLAAAPRTGGLAIVTAHGGTPEVAFCPWGEALRSETLLTADATSGAFFGPPSALDATVSGLVAVTLDQSRWSILGIQRPAVVPIPPEVEVVGVTVRLGENQQPTPMLVAKGRRLPGLWLLSRFAEPRPLFETSEPIFHVSSSTYAPRISVMTDRRLLVLAPNGDRLLELAIGGGS